MDNKQIAHELSNQLTVIRGSAELVHSRMSTYDPAERDVHNIIHAADRAISLIQQMKENCRPRQRWPKWWARGKA